MKDDSTSKPAKRKKYGKLPPDAPLNKVGKRGRAKVYDKSILVFMTQLDHSMLIRNAQRAGYWQYSGYIRFILNLGITKDSLILNLGSKTIDSLKENAEAAVCKNIEEYIKILADLKVDVS